ncbi:MAG TPA: ATP-binding protein [Kofleriaceae bacterium]|nr:ATP-binding protein [Kofleriaceae bacterium]
MGVAVLVAARTRAVADPAAVADVPHPQLALRGFGSEQGIHNLVINDLVQDDAGFLAVATNDGVYRFDGERFVRYPTRGSNSIDTLALTADGKLCGGSRQGLMCWDRIAFDTTATAGLPAVEVRKLVAHGRELWAATDHGLYVRRDHGPFMAVTDWPGSAAPRTLWVDAQGLIADSDSTLELRAPDGSWHALGPGVGLGAERIESVLRDRAGALWIRSAAHVWWLPPGGSGMRDVSDGLPPSYDTSVMVLGRRGEVWAGTDRGFAMRDGDRWRVFSADAGVPAIPVRSMLVDREATLWLGTTGGGLYQLLGRGLVEHHDRAHGLPGEFVWAIHRDPQGTLWIGTDRCLARAVDGAWRCVEGTEGRTVRSFVFSDDGGIFLGGVPPEVLYRAPDGIVHPLGDPASGPDHHILAMLIDDHHDLWIGTRSGLFRLAGARPGPLERVIVPGQRRDLWVSSLTLDDQHRVWFASQSGLGVLEAGRWRMLGAADGLASSLTQYVIQRADGRMCVTYLGAIGLACFRYAGDQVTELERIGVADGLTSGEVYLFGEDARRRLWVGTGDGIDVSTPAGFDHFDRHHGLAGNDSAAMAFLLDGDGSIWTGSSGGLSHIAAQRYDGPPPPPGVAVLDAHLGQDPWQARAAPLRVPHDHNAFDVRFAATSFLDVASAEYQTRMRPAERDWRTIRLRDAAYPALPPGAYEFDVRARLGAGAWGPTRVLRFEIAAPWWQTGWFYAGIAAITLSVLRGVYAWRQRVVLRRKSAQLIAQSDASFRAVIESMADLVSVYRDGRLAYINAAGLRLFGLDGSGERRDDADLRARVHPEDQPRAAQWVRAGHAPGDPIELRIRGGDGSWRECELSAVTAEFGGSPALVLTGRDITERKRMQSKLLISDRMASLGTLAAGIGHEINNPLTYVMGNLDVVREALDGETWPPDSEREELRQMLAESSDGAQRVSQIVKGLRSFTRCDDTRLAPVDLVKVVEQAVKLTANELYHHAQLVRDHAPTPPVIADDGRLTQVVINLIVNAVHAIPVGRRDAHRVTLRTRTDHGAAVIEVQDTGSGIAPEVLQRVFDPFFTTKNVGEGTGLGLSICHGIVSGFGGQISIESTVGQGTTVRVVLPGAASPEALPAPAPPAALPASPRHQVAIVDDDPMVGEALRRALARDNEVCVFAEARHVLDRIATGKRFDAIVSDVMMPTMTGLDLLDELERVEPDQAARLIFITGGVFSDETRRRLDQIATPRLDKPVVLGELRTLIANAGSRARRN